MKKLLSVALVAIALMACHSDIWDSIDELKKDYESLSGRVSKLEELCKEMNTNISALQTLVNAQQTGDYITAVTPITKDGKEIGYVITFAKNTPVTIYHGSNGTSGIGGQGSDGFTPVVGVAQDTDGIYYWTLNGTWMLNDKGERIRVTGLNGSDGSDGSDGSSGKDGIDGITPQLKIEEGYWFISYDNGATWTNLGKATGENGTNGANGTNGQDGKTPQLKIENGYWYVSYDNGTTWTQLGKATGEDGQNGTNGKDGDSMFKSVTQDDSYVYFTLSDNTVIKIAKGGSGSGAGEEEGVKIIDGAIQAAFSVSDSTKVYFSQGNLQYNVMAGTHLCEDGTIQNGVWKFADEQYTCIGQLNKFEKPDAWIDLFCWGTSGWNSGAKAYQPFSTSTSNSDYYPGNDTTNCLTGDYANADWGVYNAISNGGNQPGMWRVLTKDEWYFLLKNHPHGCATVMNVPGLILLPDEWKGAGVMFCTDVTDYTTNVYNYERLWIILQRTGAIFLPAASYWTGSSFVYGKGHGAYWSSTPMNSNQSYSCTFFGKINSRGQCNRSYRLSVRLVQNVQK